MQVRAPLFVLTGLVWLILSVLLGIGQFLGIVLGYPLPPFLRLVHVHAALVGGVTQLLLGALLSFPPLPDRSASHPLLYVFVNAGALGMLLGFTVGESRLVGVSGLFVLLAFLAVTSDAMRQTRSSIVRPPLALAFFGTALAAGVVGLALALGLAFRLFSPTTIGAARLAHIHLTLLGFLTLMLVGTTHHLLPSVLEGRLHSRRLAVITFVLLPLGLVALIGAVLLGRPWLPMAAGSVVFAGILTYGYNVIRTWLATGRPSTVAADHLVLATLFLLAAALAGMLVAVNQASDPPAVPFGTLHLVAYGHLALNGFILQTIVGALSHLLPLLLAERRVKSNKKRGPYLAHLTTIMARGRALQVAALNLGTAGLMLVAALVWQFPLAALPVQLSAWLAAALLLLASGLFVGKVGMVIAARPPREGKREA